MGLAVSFQQLIPNVFHKDATKALLKIFADVSFFGENSISVTPVH